MDDGFNTYPTMQQGRNNATPGYQQPPGYPPGGPEPPPGMYNRYGAGMSRRGGYDMGAYPGYQGGQGSMGPPNHIVGQGVGGGGGPGVGGPYSSMHKAGQMMPSNGGEGCYGK